MSDLSNLVLVFLSGGDNNIALQELLDMGYEKIRQDYEIK